jgi:hypothetical protein
MALQDDKKDRFKVANYIQFAQQNLQALIQLLKKWFTLNAQRASYKKQKLAQREAEWDAVRREPWLAEMEEIQKRRDYKREVDDEYEELRNQLRAKRRTPKPWTPELMEEIDALEKGVTRMQRRIMYVYYEAQALDAQVEAMLTQKDEQGNAYPLQDYEDDLEMKRAQLFGPTQWKHNKDMAKYWETSIELMDAEIAGDTDKAMALRGRLDQLADKFGKDFKEIDEVVYDLQFRGRLDREADNLGQVMRVPLSVVQKEQEALHADVAVPKTPEEEAYDAVTSARLARWEAERRLNFFMVRTVQGESPTEFWAMGDGAREIARYEAQFDVGGTPQPGDEAAAAFYRLWAAKKAETQAGDRYRELTGTGDSGPVPRSEDATTAPGYTIPVPEGDSLYFVQNPDGTTSIVAPPPQPPDDGAPGGAPAAPAAPPAPGDGDPGGAPAAPGGGD